MAVDVSDERNGSVIHLSGTRWQDWMTVFLLFLTFGPCNGILYTMGVYQAYWVQELGVMSPTRASLVSSTLFVMTCVPSPVISILIHKSGRFRPSLMVAMAIPMLTTGVLLNAYSTDFWILLLASGVFLGPAQSLMDVTSMTAVYHYFRDEQVYLFTSIVSSGVGGGMILFSTMFFLLEPSLGLRGIGFVQLSVAWFIFIIAILLFSFGHKIGMRTKYQQKRLRGEAGKELLGEERCEVCATNGVLVRRSKCPCALHAQISHSEGTVTHQDHSSGYTSRDSLSKHLMDNQEQHSRTNHDYAYDSQTSLIMMSRNTVLSDRSHRPPDVGHLVKSIFSNSRFMLMLLSYFCSTSVFNTVMYHQPTRLLAFGFSLNNGAQSIAINGFVQMVFRVLAGVLIASEKVSPFRLSELSKLGLGVLTIVSTFLPHLWCQLLYMFLIGVTGAFLNTTDFLLVKDYMHEGREFGIALLFLTDGVSTLVVDTLVGHLYQMLGNYDPIFIGLGILSCIGSGLVLVSEIIHRRHLLAELSNSFYESL
ncbi:uncharacterized protein LOC142339144 isoform X1 [Convolutriloba macropyga]|uniref:uncharacterized protein LOC142339144 isoform X1 n=1 Tax=Convolutriloba macropyga TaxID=536237 RepID=UPI003F524A31